MIIRGDDLEKALHQRQIGEDLVIPGEAEIFDLQQLVYDATCAKLEKSFFERFLANG